MRVKRYDVMSYSLDVGGNSGPFVKYEDYAALEARCAVLAAENAGLKDFVKTCFRAAADGASLVEYVSELRERAAADKGSAS